MKASLLFATVLLLLQWPLQAEKLVSVAGGGTLEKDGAATQCRLHEPFGVEFLPSGEMIVVEMVGGNRVLKVDKAGQLSLLAGTGKTGYSGDGGPALAAQFNGIHNLAVLPNGDLLLADSFNHVLRQIDAASGQIRTVAGTGKKNISAESSPALETGFSTLIQIALEPDGRHLLVADIGNRRIRRIDLSGGTILTVAGNGEKGVPADGADAKSAPLVDPRAVTPDAAGGFYILERNGNALRHVDAAGKIATVAGSGLPGYADGPALQATMRGPKHLCLDRDGSVLIADAENHVIRRFSPKTQLLTTVAGTGKKGMGAAGQGPRATELNRPHGVTIGPDGSLFITDSYNERVLKLVP